PWLLEFASEPSAINPLFTTSFQTLAEDAHTTWLRVVRSTVNGIQRAASQELTLDPRPIASTNPRPLSSSSDGADSLTPDQHRANEEHWLAHRQSLIDRLANQSIIAPSRLSHDAESAPAPDPPPEPDPQTYIRRTRRGRGGSALGRAVHAVLQVMDLATLGDLDPLATPAPRGQQFPDP